MKKQALSAEEIVKFLEKEKVGHLATVGPDGPYVIAVNYVVLNDKVYIHGRKEGGKKYDNLGFDERICFEVSRDYGYEVGDRPCKTETIYESAIGRGRARVLKDEESLTEKVLLAFAKKFAGHLSDPVIAEDKAKITGIIELSIDEWTGKHYKKSS
jgi:nitroimidazol reductase NimA-like FMN-containing flavoprotein (pyridoxamine 5'-phosphate oxidase superfamily)